MGSRDTIGAARAAVKLALADALGVTVSFSHRGAQAVTLKARVVRDQIFFMDRGGMVAEEERVVTFELPVQAGFAYSAAQAEPVTPGDRIVFNGREHFVTDPVAKDSTGRVYTLRCVQVKRLKQG